MEKVICDSFEEAKERFEQDSSKEYYFPETSSTLVRYEKRDIGYTMHGMVRLFIMGNDSVEEDVKTLQGMLEKTIEQSIAIYHPTLFMGTLYLYDKIEKTWRSF